jgi:hypothetical protein
VIEAATMPLPVLFHVFILRVRPFLWVLEVGLPEATLSAIPLARTYHIDWLSGKDVDENQPVRNAPFAARNFSSRHY